MLSTHLSYCITSLKHKCIFHPHSKNNNIFSVKESLASLSLNPHIVLHYNTLNCSLTQDGSEKCHWPCTYTPPCLLAWSDQLLPLLSWVGRGPQCSPRPAWPLQAPPEFPPSTGRDVTGPARRPAGVCPSPGSRAQGGPREEDQGPSAPRHPTHLHRPCHASQRPACCEPDAHGSFEGKTTNTLVHL